MTAVLTPEMSDVLQTTQEPTCDDIVWVRLSLRGGPPRPVPVPRRKLAALLALVREDSSEPRVRVLH